MNGNFSHEEYSIYGNTEDEKNEEDLVEGGEIEHGLLPYLMLFPQVFHQEDFDHLGLAVLHWAVHQVELTNLEMV